MTILQALKAQFNLRIYEESIPRIEKVLTLLTDEELWYRPNSETNSVGHLILHLCGNVTQWIGSGIGQRPDLRERDLEFNTANRRTKAALVAQLHALRALTDDALSMLNNDQDLLEERSVQGFDESILSILIHVTEHFSYHTGQIAVICKYLKGLDLGFYAGQDLNTKN